VRGNLILFVVDRAVKKSVKDVFKEGFDGLFENLVPDGGKVSPGVNWQLLVFSCALVCLYNAFKA